jgi:2-C-methyl-D-erythritol 4-phosphate cytidylyltransferase/2-C-methyl-D-erythritol 2,4-cyclodiphosphate synthase
LIPRVGTGFDVHVLEPGRRLVLCGVEIPHESGLAGHSDADVGIHALCDAIYGALAEGDIGRHFPPAKPSGKTPTPPASSATPPNASAPAAAASATSTSP